MWKKTTFTPPPFFPLSKHFRNSQSSMSKTNLVTMGGHCFSGSHTESSYIIFLSICNFQYSVSFSQFTYLNYKCKYTTYADVRISQKSSLDSQTHFCLAMKLGSSVFWHKSRSKFCTLAYSTVVIEDSES